MPAEANSAVFLSYASQDAEAARRICDALRGAGIEVWFDQSELVGGDAWDAKIRRQIRECALFVPLISANTQARGEGYFRLEWKLAVDRSYLMAADQPFFLPVVIDDTPGAEARVPQEFLAVQWSPLPGGAVTDEFRQLVKTLLAAGKAGAAPTASGFGTRPQSGTRPPQGSVAPFGTAPGFAPSGAGAGEVQSASRGLPVWAWAGLAAAVGGVAAIAVFLWLSSDRRRIPGGSEARAGLSPSTASGDPAARVPAKSIAVLPFENLSPDRENEYFADGMHDEVITSLTKIHDLTVISRASVMAYRKPENRDRRRIGAELGVASVLEGSVQRAGGRVKVIVQLVDTRSEVHLWGDSYTEDVSDVFAIQSKLAGAITAALKATLSPQEKSLIGRRPTQDPQAYELYLRARAMSDTLGLGSLREHYDRMVELYEQAISRDPAFALAHVQLCVTHGYLYWFGNLDPTPGRRVRAKAALDAAVRLAPEAPETTLALGAYSYFCENDWARALAEYRAAESGLPNDAQLLYFIGLTLRRLGRLPEAVVSFTRAVELNPRDVNGPVAQIETLNALRRFSEVQRLAAGYVGLFPGDPVTHHYLAAARLELDRDRAAYLRRLESNPMPAGDPHGLVKAYRLAVARGDLAAAERALADPRLSFVRSAGSIVTDPVALHRALVAFLLGRRDRVGPLVDEALAYYQAGQWSPRQEPWVQISRALALALAGRADEAARLARESVAAQGARDAFAMVPLRPAQAQVLLVLGRRDEALAVLREMMTEPCEIGPEQVRLDPLWSPLKSDPRFEETLRLARPR